MEKFIKYKRFEHKDMESLQTFFDDLIKEGWEIIHYNEVETKPSESIWGFKVVVVAGKKQQTL